MPIAIDWVSPNPLVGEWHPAQALSSCSDGILSKNNSRPRFASFGSIERPSRAWMLDPTVPVKPALLSAAASWLSKSCAAATPATNRKNSVRHTEALVYVELGEVLENTGIPKQHWKEHPGNREIGWERWNVDAGNGDVIEHDALGGCYPFRY